jgi:hypothetical protein
MLSCTPPAALNTLLWPVVTPKNRVGGSAAFSFVFAFQHIGETLDTPAENGGCGYDFASGVHKYLYAQDDPVNGRDPSGKDDLADFENINIDDSVALGKAVEYRALDMFFVKGPVGKKLVNHWLEGAGAPLKLSTDDMVEIGACSMISGGPPTITEGDNFDQYLQRLSGGPVQIQDMRLYLGATERATLGRFFGHVSGTLSGSAGDWTFNGKLWFTDREKFDQSESGTWYRNVVCWLVSLGYKGTDYNVTSESPPAKQSSSDGQIQWAGTGKGTKNSGRPENGNPTND